MEIEKKLLIRALIDGKGDNLLNKTNNDFLILKNPDFSIQMRLKAESNHGKLQNNSELYADILRDYSASISYAPLHSREQALGYAGRSLLLYQLTRYEESVRDIDRALVKLKNDEVKVKLFARRALCLAYMNDPEKYSDIIKAYECIDKIKIIKSGKVHKLNFENKQNLRLLISQVEKDIKQVVPKEVKEENKKAKIIAMLKQKESEDPFENVDIRFNKKYGRHLIAKKDFKAGEIICVQKPYAMSSNTESLPFAYCCHCMQISWDSVPCQTCGWALFCSEKCREEAYEQYHDIECRVMPPLRENIPDNFKQLVIRTIVMAVRECGDLAKLKKEIEKVDACFDERTKGFSEEGTFDGSKFRSIYSLIHKVPDDLLDFYLEDSLKVLFAFLNCSTFLGNKKYGNIFELINDKDMMFVASLILRLIKVFNINHQITVEPNICCQIGRKGQVCQTLFCCYRAMTITPLFGILNHSCMPNVQVNLTDASNVLLHASRPVKKDEQLFISYGYHYFFVEKSKRAIELARNYNFTCNCKACVNNWPIQSKLNELETLNFELNMLHINSQKLDDIKDLIYQTTHPETHSLEQLQELGKAFSRVVKNYAEPSVIICALINAVERVSRGVYLTKLIDEFKK